MAQRGQLIPVRTNPATQLRAAAAQNAALTINLTRPPGGSVLTVNALGYVDDGVAAGDTVRARLAAISLVSIENLTWEISLWGSDTFNTGTFIADGWPFLGAVTLLNTSGARIAASGAYYYYSGNLDVPYQDFDRTGEVHLMVIPRSAGKSADDGGAIQVNLFFEPTLGF